MTKREFLHWLGTPLRAFCGWFPFTQAGRQTLVYLIFAGAGPALTVFVWWAMIQLQAAAQWGPFSKLAYIVAAGMLIIVCGLAMFVSVRAVKLGKDGLETEGWRGGAEEAADKVAVAAAEKADEIKEGVQNGIAGSS